MIAVPSLSRSTRAAAGALGLATLLAGGCATLPGTPGANVLPAPPALTMTGIPPVPAALAERIGRYNDFKGARLLDWSPDGKQLLVAWLQGTRSQLHQVAAPGAPLAQITRSNEPLSNGEYLPADPNVVIYTSDVGGSEAGRIYRYDIRAGAAMALTPSGRRAGRGPFTNAGTAGLATLVGLDAGEAGRVERAAGGVGVELVLIDYVSGGLRSVAMLPGTGWFPSDIAPDDKRALLMRYVSASETEVWSIDLASGERRKLLPRAGEPAAFYGAAGFAADGRRIFVSSDRGGEFRQVFRHDPQSGSFEPITGDRNWDTSLLRGPRDRSKVAVISDEAGRGVLRLFDAATLKPIPLALPEEASIGAVRFAPAGDRLAFNASSSRSPAEVHVLDLKDGASTRWVAADTAGIDTARFAPTEVVRWTSFDGRSISGLLTRPPASFTGKRPVLIDIHGGPEAQARLGFLGRYNFIVNELGIAFLQPNVRGSTGFGRSFHQLDNGKLREDSVKDIGALLDWIAQQPDLDASRVVVQGGSYGGYMANAVAVHYSDRIRGAIPSVGISNFVTFLERTESYRRDLRRAEYGDERDPAMREFLTQISPLTHAAKIKSPMFIVHGRNDPRVPVQEAEQIAATVKKSGVPVWLMIAENEGHGFAKKENGDYLFATRVLFLQTFLLGR
jgi:dipeptidyl aminopeptidase/acylaminoacyl peptidase